MGDIKTNIKNILQNIERMLIYPFDLFVPFFFLHKLQKVDLLLLDSANLSLWLMVLFRNTITEV